MEIIQEIIGTRKKQQILNQEAKKTLHKQIKKVTHREVSEPPPTNKTIISNIPQQQQIQQQKAPDSKKRDDSVGSAYQQSHNHQQHQQMQSQQVLQQSSSSKRSERRGDQQEASGHGHGHHQQYSGSQQQQMMHGGHHQADHHHHHTSSKQQSSSAVKQQTASPKIANGSKKQSQNQQQNETPAGALQQSSSQKNSSNSKKQNNQQSNQNQQQQLQQQMQDMRVRKVRSKSPPTNESGKNPAAKIKKFYDGMIPSFTNKKRQHAYYNTAKQGFTYINWDMENELYIFQTQIEQKFRKSAMNKNFVFPRIESTATRNDGRTRGSFEQNNTSNQPSQHLAQSASQSHTNSKQLLNSGRQVKAFSPDQHVNRKNSRGVKQPAAHANSAAAYPQTEKAQALDKQIGSIELDAAGGPQMNKQVPRLFNAAAISQAQNQTTGELSARAAAAGGKGSQSVGPHANSDSKMKNTTSGASNYNNKSVSKTTTPGSNNVSSLKVNASSTSHPMSKSVLKPSDTSSSSKPQQHQHQEHSSNTTTTGGAVTKCGSNSAHDQQLHHLAAQQQESTVSLQNQQHQQISAKKKDKTGAGGTGINNQPQNCNSHATLNLASQTSSTNSLKLNNQSAKQLSSMVKQATGTSNGSSNGPANGQHQSSLFSPNQSAVSRKNPKQMIQTTYVNMKGNSSNTLTSSTSQKTYGLHQNNTAVVHQHHHHHQTMPNTPLPNTNPQSSNTSSQYGTHQVQAHSRDQSVKSQREVQQLQQGQSEPLFKKATTYMSRKNGQQHSVNSRMPKASPSYCTTQFNNSVNSSQMLLNKQANNVSGSGQGNITHVNLASAIAGHSDNKNNQQVSSRLGGQNSIDPGKDLSSNQNSGKKINQVSDLSISQYTNNQRLNESVSALHHHSSNNVIKFSSEYGTYNTVQLAGEDMDNRSSDYVGGCVESTSRQSQKTNPMQISGIVSPDIQIQSIEQEGYEPTNLIGGSVNTTNAGNKLLMQMPYGGQIIDGPTIQATKMARSGQNSVQAMRNSGIGQQSSTRLSPATKKRNIRGQMSSQMNKTTSVNEAKKQIQKHSSNFNQSTQNMNRTSKNLYKTMIKPGAISSQSFIHAPDATSTVKSVNTKHTQNRFNSQTPRNVTSPEHQHTGIQNQNKLQKTSDQKQENNNNNNSNNMLGGRGATSSIVHQTPSNKIRGSNSKVQRGASLNSKEMALVSKFKTDYNSGPMINQYTPGQQKMAPSKAFKGSDSKQMKDFSPNTGQKNIRSRNAEAGKQTADHVHLSAKWIDEKQQALTLKKVTDGKNTVQGGNLSKRAEKKSQGPSKRQQQYNRHDTEECENFDMKDLDEREPCQQSFPTHDFHSVGREQQKMSMKVPLTTRSTHSLALNNHLKKQMTQDLNLTSPAQLEESVNSGQPGHNNSSQQLSYGGRQKTHTQPQIKYRNEIKLQGGQIAQPHAVNSFHNLNPEYLSGDGGSSHMDGSAPIISGGGDSMNHQHTNTNLLNNTIGQHPTVGSVSASELGVGTTVTSMGAQKPNQASTMKDFFLAEDTGYEVIKEEKHQKTKTGKGQSQQSIAAGSTSVNMKNSRTKSGQLNLMARDFTMQNYQVMKNGQSTKVLNLPPKPSRNAKNNTLVLGNSTGAPTRSMQSITLNKVKNFNQQQTMQQTMVMTPKREQFNSNNLFKGFQQARSKLEKNQSSSNAANNHVSAQQQSNQFKNTSFKEHNKMQNQSNQMRYSLNKTTEKKDQSHHNVTQSASNNPNNGGNNRYSIQEQRGSPRVQKQKFESAKKVSKVASQENLKGFSGPGASHQYSMSLIAASTGHHGQKQMPQTPHLHSIQNTAEKKGAKHLYMSLNKEMATKTATSKGSQRDKSLSTERYHCQSNQRFSVQNSAKQGGGHYHSLTSGKSREKQSMPQKQRGSSGCGAVGFANNNSHHIVKGSSGTRGDFSPHRPMDDYEIVFDHLHEDSIPDNPSYDMEEQPTVVLVDDFSNQQINSTGLKSHNPTITKHHKSKERNASLLNSSALSRDQQISHPFAKSSIEPMTIPTTNGRNTVKDTKNALNQDQLPKLGSTDSKLFRQSIGQMQTTPSVGPSITAGGPHLQSNTKQASNSSTSTGVMKDMHSFNKSLSKKTSALKLKQGGAGGTSSTSQTQHHSMSQTTNVVGSQPSSQGASVSLYNVQNHHTSQAPSITSYIAAQQQVSQNAASQQQQMQQHGICPPQPLNKTQSIHSSQASLHAAMGSGLAPSGGKNMHLVQQPPKLMKTASQPQGNMIANNNGSLLVHQGASPPSQALINNNSTAQMHQQKMIETYAAAKATTASGMGSSGVGHSTNQQYVVSANKKTTKKSMIKQ